MKDHLVVEVRPSTSTVLRLSFTIVFRPSVIMAIMYLTFIVFISLTRNYSALDYAHLGTVWSEHNKGGTWGYDGQFYYQLAHNPLTAYNFMDNAPYRYQRILYPLVVFVLSLGKTALLPYLLLFVNWLSIVFSVEVVSRLLIKHHFSPWFSLALGLYFGQAVALTFDTAEPFACLLLCIGVWLLEEEYIGWAAIFMGLASLSRETAVLFPAGYVAFFFIHKRWKEVILLTTLGIMPLIAWLVILWKIFGATGLTFTPPFEHTPFAGIFFYFDTPRKFWLLFLLMFIPTLGSCILAGMEMMRRRIGPMFFIWLANLLMIILMSHYSYIELISCGRVTIALVLAGLLYGITARNRVILWAMQFYTLTFVVFLVGVLLHVQSFIL